MLNEERKFLAYEKIKRRGLYDIVTEWQKVLKYAKRYFKVNISKEDYLELIVNYSDLKARYLRQN